MKAIGNVYIEISLALFYSIFQHDSVHVAHTVETNNNNGRLSPLKTMMYIRETTTWTSSD